MIVYVATMNTLQIRKQSHLETQVGLGFKKETCDSCHSKREGGIIFLSVNNIKVMEFILLSALKK